MISTYRCRSGLAVILDGHTTLEPSTRIAGYPKRNAQSVAGAIRSGFRRVPGARSIKALWRKQRGRLNAELYAVVPTNLAGWVQNLIENGWHWTAEGLLARIRIQAAHSLSATHSRHLRNCLWAIRALDVALTCRIEVFDLDRPLRAGSFA